MPRFVFLSLQQQRQPICLERVGLDVSLSLASSQREHLLLTDLSPWPALPGLAMIFRNILEIRTVKVNTESFRHASRSFVSRPPEYEHAGGSRKQSLAERLHTDKRVVWVSTAPLKTCRRRLICPYPGPCYPSTSPPRPPLPFAYTALPLTASPCGRCI